MAGIATGCATGAHGPRARGVNVIAHRGASAYAPENTIAAFRLAAEMEADWFELDCTLTKDGEVIVIHDGSIDRTTTGKGAIADLTLAEARQYDAGSWKDPKFKEERLPTLAETLDFAKDTIGVYIEIKDSNNDGELKAAILEMTADAQTLSPKLRKEMMARIEEDGTRNLELTRKTVALVRERNMKNEIVIQSFSPIICAIVSSEAPELRVELLSGSHKDNPAGWEEALRWAYLLDVDGFNCDADGINPGRLAMFHAAGKTMAAWTVDATPEMRRLAGWGVDSIITNRPDACLAEMKENGYR